MRVLVLSDVHANQIALERVLADCGPYDQLWNLGDTIGYGPRPNECVAALSERASVMLGGNHDLACLGKVDLNDFNPDARVANIWNSEQLTPRHQSLLNALPPLQALDERFLIAHGSPRDPVWEYLLTVARARDNFALFRHQVCCIGHSHIPLIFCLYPDGRCEGPLLPDDETVLELQPGVRYFINPGSVGQPRDHDPRAAYVVLDTDANRVSFHRVEYDVAATQAQMREAGLPEALIRRLEYGM